MYNIQFTNRCLPQNYLGLNNLLEDMDLSTSQKKELIDILEGSERTYIDSIKFLLLKNKSQDKKSNQKLLKDLYFMLLGLKVYNRQESACKTLQMIDNEIKQIKEHIENLKKEGKDYTYYMHNLEYYEELYQRFD